MDLVELAKAAPGRHAVRVGVRMTQRPTKGMGPRTGGAARSRSEMAADNERIRQRNRSLKAELADQPARTAAAVDDAVARENRFAHLALEQERMRTHAKIHGVKADAAEKVRRARATASPQQAMAAAGAASRAKAQGVKQGRRRGWAEGAAAGAAGAAGTAYGVRAAVRAVRSSRTKPAAVRAKRMSPTAKVVTGAGLGATAGVLAGSKRKERS